MYPRVLGWLPPRAGVIQDAAFLNMVKSKREYEEAKHGYGYGSAPNTLFGNLRWQQKIMAKKLNEVLHENPI